jgi:ParB-like chromosome segregation protein Spo0J
MSEKENLSPEPHRSAAKTQPTTVPLNEFVLKPALYCHRDPAELTDRERLKPLMDSIRTQGRLSPVEFFRGPDGEPIPDQGHRRISCCRFLAQDGVVGFTATMDIPSIEVVGATQQQILIRSVAENVFRQALSMMERIRAAKTLKDNGVALDDIAAALGIGPKQSGKDIRIASVPWMLSHIEKEDIGHTVAADLLEAASARDVDREADLQKHFADWVMAQRKVVGKDKKLKGMLTKALTDRWIALLKEKKPLDDKVERRDALQAEIDAEANVVTVAGTLNLMNVPLEELERAKASLAAAEKVVDTYLQTRAA